MNGSAFEGSMMRRLAAVLVADVVGFSHLMGQDESGTYERLETLRTDVVEPLLQEHGGRIVKELGDGYLVEFGSAVAAVNCALAWHEAVAEHQLDRTSDRIVFRIGVHVGDVIVRDEDLFGEGVNIAARLEPLADPGGVVVSESVHREVRGKVAASFQDRGEHQLKNIAEPVHLFCAVPRALGGAAAVPALALPAKPSIAVLPLVNLSADPEQDYFSDGITEDLIVGLSRLRWLFVIARNSSFAYRGRTTDPKAVATALGVRYVLDGSVRRAGDRVRVTLQLVDATTDVQLWAQRFESALSDIFLVQDEIVDAVVGAIEPELAKSERRRAEMKLPTNLDAWDLYQRGMSHLYQYTKEDLVDARRFFDEAKRFDPRLGAAYSGEAETYYYEVVYGFAASVADARDRALAPAVHAVALDEQDAAAHCTLGRTHYLRREHDEAILELEAALALNPSLALAHYGIGAALVFSGRARDAFPHLTSAIRLSPYDPNMGSFLVRLADASFLTGDFDAAMGWAKKALRQPHFQWSRFAVLLAALGASGKATEGTAYLAQVLRRRPDFSVEFVRNTHLFSDEEDFGRYLDGLRQAGVPEATRSPSATA